MLRFKVYQVIVHIAGWLLFMAFPLFFINGGQSGTGYFLLKEPYYWLFCLSYFTLYYFNAHVLISNLFLKKRYAWYSIIVLLLFAGVYILQPYDRLLRCNGDRNLKTTHTVSPDKNKLAGNDGMPPPGNDPMLHPGDRGPHGPHDNPGPHGPSGRPPGPGPGDMPPHFDPQPGYPRHHFDMFSVFIFLIIMAVSTAVKVMQQWQVTEQRATRAEADKASAELSFLKAQINPHFLFNTLNNIYTLVVIKDENAADSIMKLSNIMRYVTDDSNEAFVPLQDEIDFIKDYIELQRLRLGEQTYINLDISGDIEDKNIAPLILMTFIENVFKYGISKHNKSVIVIKINGSKMGISFFCQNRIFPEKEENRRAGIGLKNTRQRLAYLYPGKHTLNIDDENQLYTVELTLRTS
jgi:two-component system LytT family sensor kinase